MVRHSSRKLGESSLHGEISARVGGKISQDVPTCTQGTLSNIITRESEQTWLKVGPQREGGDGDKYFLEKGEISIVCIGAGRITVIDLITN